MADGRSETQYIETHYSNLPWEVLSAPDDRDSVGKPIHVEGAYQIHKPKSLPELSEVTSRLAQWSHEKKRRLMAMSGTTSAGLFQLEDSADTGKGVDGVKMELINDLETLEKVAHIEILEGKPASITVPGTATIHTINKFLQEKYGDSFRVDFDITTDQCSGVGANFVTGGLGESREAIPVEKMVAVDAQGKILTIEDPKIIDSYRGSQGAKGTVTEVTLKISEVPPKSEMVVLPLKGDYTRVYGKVVPHLQGLLWEYIQSRDPKGPYIEGIEILDRTGLEKAAKRGVHLANRYLENTLGKDCQSAVVLKIRHSFEENLETEIVNNGEDPQAHPFIAKLYRILFNAAKPHLVGDNPMIIDGKNDPEEADALRGIRISVPEIARKPGNESATQSIDRDVVIEVKGVELEDPVDVWVTRLEVKQAMQALMAITIEGAGAAEQEGIETLWNGHLLGVNRQHPEPQKHDPDFNGGANVHQRFTGTKSQKERIQGIIEQINTKTIALHGKRFGENAEIKVVEGEKHYPTDQQGLDHLTRTRPDLARARFKDMTEPDTFNFRMVKTARSVMESLNKVATPK